MNKVNVETNPVERLVMWRCDGCGGLLKKAEVEPFGDGYCHIIPVQFGEDDWEPQPCGPVNKLDT